MLIELHCYKFRWLLPNTAQQVGGESSLYTVIVWVVSPVWVMQDSLCQMCSSSASAIVAVALSRDTFNGASKQIDFSLTVYPACAWKLNQLVELSWKKNSYQTNFNFMLMSALMAPFSRNY